MPRQRRFRPRVPGQRAQRCIGASATPTAALSGSVGGEGRREAIPSAGAASTGAAAPTKPRGQPPAAARGALIRIRRKRKQHPMETLVIATAQPTAKRTKRVMVKAIRRQLARTTIGERKQDASSSAARAGPPADRVGSSDQEDRDGASGSSATATEPNTRVFRLFESVSEAEMKKQGISKRILDKLAQEKARSTYKSRGLSRSDKRAAQIYDKKSRVARLEKLRKFRLARTARDAAKGDGGASGTRAAATVSTTAEATGEGRGTASGGAALGEATAVSGPAGAATRLDGKADGEAEILVGESGLKVNLVDLECKEDRDGGGRQLPGSSRVDRVDARYGVTQTSARDNTKLLDAYVSGRAAGGSLKANIGALPRAPPQTGPSNAGKASDDVVYDFYYLSREDLAGLDMSRLDPNCAAFVDMRDEKSFPGMQQLVNDHYHVDDAEPEYDSDDSNREGWDYPEESDDPEGGVAERPYPFYRSTSPQGGYTSYREPRAYAYCGSSDDECHDGSENSGEEEQSWNHGGKINLRALRLSHRRRGSNGAPSAGTRMDES